VLDVVCVLSEAGKKYDYSHVERLRRQIKLKQPYRFTCLDDSPYPSWWSKISLFEPGRFTGRVLYLDLDVEIVDYLDEIADYPAPFAAVRDYLNKSLINSSVMSWNAGEQDHIYTKFKLEFMDKFPGDQEYINSVSIISKFPKKWFPSYRYDCSQGTPSGAKAVIYHGAIKPWDAMVVSGIGSEKLPTP